MGNDQVAPPVCPLCQCQSEVDQMDGLELDVQYQENIMALHKSEYDKRVKE